MTHCMAIDVSKQLLNIFEGERSLKVKNDKGLKELKAYIEKCHLKTNARKKDKRKRTKSKNNGTDNRYKNSINDNRYKKPYGKDFYIVFEPTGVYSNYLKEFCIRNRIKAYIVNPKRSSNFAKAMGNRSKTDRIDAKMLYASGALIDDKDMKVPDDDNVSNILSVYLSVYQFLMKTKISISNHIRMLEYTNISSFDKSIVSLLKSELKEYDGMQNDIIKKAEEVIKSNTKLKRKYENLLTVPGIGKVSAISLISLFLRFKNTNRNEITALVGLDPTRKESGTSVRGKRRISKSGDKTIRKMLYMPTMNAINNNELIKTFYSRLVNEKHKPKKLALIVSMRKLLLIAHSIYKNGTVFSYDYNEHKHGYTIEHDYDNSKHVHDTNKAILNKQ